MKRLILFLVLATVSTVSFAYNIGVREIKPFAYMENGEWQGYAINLFKLSFPYKDYKFIKADSIDDALDGTNSGEFDMTIGAFNPTQDRERLVDFSHPYLITNIAVATFKKSSALGNLLWIGQRVGTGIVIFIIILYVVGFVVDKMDGNDKIRNPHEGAWWALVTFSTVGYGDLVPITVKGKITAALWITLSLFMISAFTGYMSSAMTVKRLAESPTSLGYLTNTKLSTVSGSTSQNILDRFELEYEVYPDVESMVKSLINSESTAIIYDKLVLEYYLKGESKYIIWDIPTSHKEYYSFIFPQDSKLTEVMNVGMLGVLPSLGWRRIHNSYF